MRLAKLGLQQKNLEKEHSAQVSFNLLVQEVNVLFFENQNNIWKNKYSFKGVSEEPNDLNLSAIRMCWISITGQQQPLNQKGKILTKPRMQIEESVIKAL